MTKRLDVLANMKKKATAEDIHVLESLLSETFIIMTTDATGKIIDVNDQFVKTFEYSLEEVKMQGDFMLNPDNHSDQFFEELLFTLQSGEKWTGELSKKKKNNQIVWLKSVIIPFQNQSVTQFIEISFDITKQKNVQNWQQLAFHHELTNLPNRRMLYLLIDTYMQRAQQKQTKVAILFLGINEFKQINDTYGHRIGDLFLQEIGNRLLRLAETNRIFHISGDGFVIIIEDVDDLDMQVQEVNEPFSKPFMIKDSHFYASVSIGISMYPEHSADPITLIDYAEKAMFESKRDVMNHYTVYR